MASDLASWLEETRRWTDEALEAFVPTAEEHPAELHRAMRYALFGGGKRLRPALVRLTTESFGADTDLARRPGAALELVHTYSLVHDDLPCMDDDDLRRGRPTVHVAFDEAMAVLVGDALQCLAFEVLSEAPQGAELAGVLARGAGSVGMVGGQVLDLGLEAPRGADELHRVLDIHGRKTAALFAAAAEMGAVVAGASQEERGLAATFGRSLGLLFQAVDDLLDVTGDATTLGKTPGKDAALERETVVAAIGQERARSQAERLANEAREALSVLGWERSGLAAVLVDYVLERSA